MFKQASNYNRQCPCGTSETARLKTLVNVNYTRWLTRGTPANYSYSYISSSTFLGTWRLAYLAIWERTHVSSPGRQPPRIAGVRWCNYRYCMVVGSSGKNLVLGEYKKHSKPRQICDELLTHSKTLSNQTVIHHVPSASMHCHQCLVMSARWYFQKCVVLQVMRNNPQQWVTSPKNDGDPRGCHFASRHFMPRTLH